jgi:hypothetical protein
MRINGVLTGYSDPAAFGQRGEAPESTVASIGKSGEGRTVAGNPDAAAMTSVLARYDVTDITPVEFSEMIQQLHDRGAITEQEYQQLAAVRIDLDNEGVGEDDSIDLVQFYARMVQRRQHLQDLDADAKGRQQLGQAASRLDWLQKFALIQASPDAIGLDAVV